MIRFVFLTCVILILSACKAQTTKAKDKIQYLKCYDYRIVIDIGSSFWGLGTRYILDNGAIDYYDSIDAKQGRLKPLTLYYISLSKTIELNGTGVQTLSPADSVEIKFSKENSDELFNLIRSFFKRLTLNNIDTFVNGSKTERIVEDDASAIIELDFRGRKLYGQISSISNPSISTVEFDELLKFIQK